MCQGGWKLSKMRQSIYCTLQTDWHTTALPSPVLEAHQWSANREQLVTRDRAVMGGIEIAELPDGSLRPLLVQFGFDVRHLVHQLHVQFLAVGEFLHDREEPFAHAARKIEHFFFSACLEGER